MIGNLDCGSGFGIGIKDWGLGLGIWIEDGIEDWGLGIGIRDWD